MKNILQTAVLSNTDTHLTNDNVIEKSISHKIAKIHILKWLIMLIPLAFVIFTLLISLFSVIEKSFISKDGFTLEYIIKVCTEPMYLKVLGTTIETALYVTVCTLILAYPAAYLSVNVKKTITKRLITAGILIPYWISMLVRIFSWQIILQTNGLINQTLMFFKIINEPIEFMYTPLAVIISMTHILLPYMFLSLQSNMEGIDKNLLTAAKGMGAKPYKSFKDIFLPLSMPGIFSGSLMVFVLSLGFYIAPALLGGPSNMMISNIIEQNMNNFNQGVASALSLQLLVIVFLIVGISFKFVGNIFIQKR